MTLHDKLIQRENKEEAARQKLAKFDDNYDSITIAVTIVLGCIGVALAMIGCVAIFMGA